MQFKKSILGSVITVALSASVSSVVSAQEINVDTSRLIEAGSPVQNVQSQATSYIVQLKDQPAIAQSQEIGELLPSNQLVSTAGNQYNAMTPAMQAYTQALEAKQAEVAGEIGNIEIIHSFKHTFNGFTAKLTPEQKSRLEAHPDILNVWEDRLETITTANTPEFLGLSAAGGQHALDIKGEGVIIGVMDTGIWPEHPSFADDGSYSDPATIGWQGICDQGDDPDFACSNKLIGARFYNESFKSQYEIQTDLGEFLSPRDADGHGSHTAGTAGGNEGVAANANGFDAGVVSGIAPRARIAVYKTCWNSDYVSPEGNRERGCFYGDNMAAIDQAVVDGVDVINYSIGGSLTDLTTPPAAAMLRATQAGVFVAVSAGNDGDNNTAETVGTPAPWVTSVGASTYSGTVPTAAIKISSRTPEEFMVAIEGAITKPFQETGVVSGQVVIAEPLLACFENGTSAALDNAEAISGNVALISRGACNFTEKVERAQLAGATAVVVYSDDREPTGLGGDGSYDIPGVMISQADGIALSNAITGGEAVEITMGPGISTTVERTGNTMADFSSQGPNSASYDIIKPDITAPGFQILAATTEQPMFDPHGESFRYLNGTSMSSPHIAGMAALFKQSNSSWSPAQIKSALMTTARQNVTKSDGTTPADPFDFGSGHAQPVQAMDPGLLFDANFNDYLAFLCGLGEQDYVAGNGTDCDTLTAAGFTTDASQLNLPSIGIAELLEDETIFRTVSNATGVASVYSATIEAPAGIAVTLQTYDSEGNLTPEDTLSVDANGKANFSLTFSRTDSANINNWEFGAITWTDGAGHSVRLPIAIKALPTVKIEVPELISGAMTSGRYSYPVRMLYTGATSVEHAGLTPAVGLANTVSQDADGTFSFNEAGLGTHIYLVPEGTKMVRFNLSESLIDAEGADLDLYLYRCAAWRCSPVTQSATVGSSNENILLTNPVAANDGDAGDVYIVWVHARALDVASTDYTMPVWLVDSADSATRVITSSRAMNGRFNYTTIMASGLIPGMTYMGTVTYFNDEGVAEGTTILELRN
ncbi:S8 family serine peptidase [Thalassomonas viridans]|uniref:S8 family serine peptidase n=1 Tax=Thalassomonas viridans TaxID=137584 RepID=A0AAF0CAQ6_9GAMM|nr:S8 family serine peptidase [Thalassomonas viridans]WDE06585.1 S8 family serine peptidase [Thalassomonas viridans]